MKILGVEFDKDESEDDDASRALKSRRARKFSLINIIKKLRLARTDTQAFWILVVISIICILAAVGIVYYYIYIQHASKAQMYVPTLLKQGATHSSSLPPIKKTK